MLLFSFRSAHINFYYYLNILVFYKHDTRSIFWKMFWAVNGILFGRNCFNIKTVNVRKHNTIVYVHSLIVHCHLFSFQTQSTGVDEINFFSRVFFFKVRVVSARRDRQAPDMMWSVYFKDPYERWAGFKQATPNVVEQPMTWKLGVIKAHTGTYYEFLFSVVETVLLLFFLVVVVVEYRK